MKNKIYVALLRGINVGGRNKIDMKTLKETFEKAGMQSVTTYINSGNIVFANDTISEDKLPGILEEAILKDFGLSIKVLIRTYANLEEIIQELPEAWQNNSEMKSDVLFLQEEIADRSILSKLEIKLRIDDVKFVAGTILWKTNRKNAGKSGKMKLAGTALYKKMTIRNVNTARKIFEIMSSLIDG